MMCLVQAYSWTDHLDQAHWGECVNKHTLSPDMPGSYGGRFLGCVLKGEKRCQ